MLSTYELARRLPMSANTTVNALHPGIVNTELQRRGRDRMRAMVQSQTCSVSFCGTVIKVAPRRFLVPEKPAWWLQPLLQAASLFVKTPEQVGVTRPMSPSPSHHSQRRAES